MRPVVLLAVLFLGACVWQSGPDCSGACDQIRECKDLDKTFRLSCSQLGSGCYQAEVDCADCIEKRSCAELVAGECDSLCVVTPAP